MRADGLANRARGCLIRQRCSKGVSIMVMISSIMASPVADPKVPMCLQQRLLLRKHGLQQPPDGKSQIHSRVSSQGMPGCLGATYVSTDPLDILYVASYQALPRGSLEENGTASNWNSMVVVYGFGRPWFHPSLGVSREPSLDWLTTAADPIARDLV